MKVAIRESGVDGNVLVWPLEMVLRRSAELGYQAVELNSTPDTATRGSGRRRCTRGVWAADMDRHDRAELRKTVESLGLEVSSLSTTWAGTHWTPNSIEKRDSALGILEQDIQLASDLGASVILIHMGGATGTWNEVEGFLAEAAKAAERVGTVKLGFESPLWLNLGLGDISALVRMVDQVGSDHFGVYLHPMYPQGELLPHEEIELVGQRLVCLHSGPMDPTLDYQAYFDALNKVAYDGYWVFEVSGADIVDSREAWQKIVKKHWFRRPSR